MTARPVTSMFSRKYRSIAAIAISPRSISVASARTLWRRCIEAAPPGSHAHSSTVGSLPRVASIPADEFSHGRLLRTTIGKTIRSLDASVTKSVHTPCAAVETGFQETGLPVFMGQYGKKSTSSFHRLSRRCKQVITGNLPRSGHRRIWMWPGNWRIAPLVGKSEQLDDL